MVCGATAITLLSLLTAVISAADLEIPDPPVTYPPKVLDGTEGQVCPSDDQREDARDEIDDEIRSLLQDMLQQCPGNQQDNPASSCLAVFQCDPSSPSADYWIATTSDATLVYCDMSRELCGIQGGWARIGHLDMTDPSQSCPSGWREFTEKRTCGITPTYPLTGVYKGGYETITYSIDGMSYSQICGKIIGYQYGTPDAFGPYNNNQWTLDSIDEIYMDGVSITYGINPRTHVWSLASSFADTVSDSRSCPCTTLLNWSQKYDLPPWVGSDYFCEAGVITSGNVDPRTFYPDDPLWDGLGCPDSTAPCCELNSPPWFYKQLSESTNEGIEVRVMANEVTSNLIENVPIELLEIYVQ